MDIQQKIRKYCAEAERCTADVVQKLIDWNVDDHEQGAILEALRKEKFLDDQRFLTLYVMEKWRLNHWGKLKIKSKLYEKGFEKKDIATALVFITEEEYVMELSKMLEQKHKTIVKDPHEAKLRKLLAFAGSRGFEEEYILKWLEQKRLI